MDVMIAGFVVSTIGLGIFLYGRKQRRPPQLVAGSLMMVLPFAVPGALWIWIGGAVAIGTTWVAVRAGM